MYNFIHSKFTLTFVQILAAIFLYLMIKPDYTYWAIIPLVLYGLANYIEGRNYNAS